MAGRLEQFGAVVEKRFTFGTLFGFQFRAVGGGVFGTLLFVGVEFALARARKGLSGINCSI